MQMRGVSPIPIHVSLSTSFMAPRFLYKHPKISVDKLCAIEQYMSMENKIASVIESLRNTIVFDSRDYAQDKRSAWIYGIIVGWDDQAMEELANRFAWDDKLVTRLRELHKIVESIK